MLLNPRNFWRVYFTVLASRAFKNTNIGAQRNTTSVHAFQQQPHQCALQLGNPPAGRAGIVITASTWVPQAAGVPKKGGGTNWGSLEIIQNVNYTYRRNPPLTPALNVIFECASSNGVWQRDGAGVISPVPGPGNATITFADSPAVFLSNGGMAFEGVTADANFRTYFSWISPGGMRIPLARYDWSWKGQAVCAQGANDCRDVVGGNPQGWGFTKGSDVVPPPRLKKGLAAAFDSPVLSPSADPTVWNPC